LRVQTVTVEPTKTYNLTLEKDNAYYANGILVFNCLTWAQSVAVPKPKPQNHRRPAVSAWG
jgi:hypothetical protein